MTNPKPKKSIFISEARKEIEVAKTIDLGRKKFTVNVLDQTSMLIYFIHIRNLAKQVEQDKSEIGNPKIIRNLHKKILIPQQQVEQVWHKYKCAFGRKTAKLSPTLILPVLGPEKKISKDKVIIAFRDMTVGKSEGESEVTTALIFIN